MCLPSAICSTLCRKLFLHRSNRKRVAASASPATAIYSPVHEYWWFVYVLRKTKLPHGSICFSCSPRSHLSPKVRAFVYYFPSAEVILGKTVPELQAQAELMVFLHWVENTGKPSIRTQKVSYQKCLSASNKYGSAISYSFFFINALPFSW